MRGFSGFPDGKQETVILPALFFSELLPQIDHLAEMQVTLYCFWAVQKQDGQYRYLKYAEITQDMHFMKAFPNEDVVQDAIERAIARGTLLQLELSHDNSETDTLLFINSANGRATIEAIQHGDFMPGDSLRPVQVVFERPNAFNLYEQNIGVLTPMVADQLNDLEKTYSNDWIAEAIQIAVERNVRNLRYIIGILKNWEQKGKGGKTAKQDDDFDKIRRDLGF